MTTIFSCKSSPNVLMTDAVATEVLKTLGKIKENETLPTWGVITRDEVEHALCQLKKTVNDSRQHEKSEAVKRDVTEHHHEYQDNQEDNAIDHVTFATHLVPFIDMLEQVAQKDIQKKDQILWGK